MCYTRVQVYAPVYQLKLNKTILIFEKQIPVPNCTDSLALSVGKYFICFRKKKKPWAIKSIFKL